LSQEYTNNQVHYYGGPSQTISMYNKCLWYGRSNNVNVKQIISQINFQVGPIQFILSVDVTGEIL